MAATTPTRSIQQVATRATSLYSFHSIPSNSRSLLTLTSASSKVATNRTPQRCLSVRQHSLLSFYSSREVRQRQQYQHQHGQRRNLHKSSSQQQVAIQNARMDEKGNEMTVEITPRAASRLSQIAKKEANPSLALRVSVEAGGCHGFQYLMSLTDMSKISQDEDTVFVGGEGAKIVMDEPSLELLKGSKVDYTMELIGSQFKIVDNPLATSSCGCGTSFDVKS